MPDKQKRFTSFFASLFVFSCCLGFTSLFFSPFLLSVSVVLAGISGLPFIKGVVLNHRWVLAPFMVMISIYILDLTRSSDINQSLHQLSFSVSFFLVLTAGFYHLKSNSKHFYWLVGWLTLITLAVNLHAFINYLQNREAIDLMLSQGKSVPLINQFHHIHFGIINSLMILLLGYLVLNDMRFQNALFYIAFGIIVICFHVLSSRTGLFAIYITVGVIGVVETIKTRNFKTLGFGVIVVSILVFATYQWSSSFRAKMNNSIEDVSSWGKQDDINFQSMAMRIEAYKMSTSLVIQHPIMGVGVSKANEALQKEYIRQNTVLIPINRIGPHNQYLEWGVKFGLVGLLALPFFFFVVLKRWRAQTWLYLSFILVIFISLFFESLFERQASIFFMALFIGLGRCISPKGKN